jgi:hypothetical protein
MAPPLEFSGWIAPGFVIELHFAAGKDSAIVFCRPNGTSPQIEKDARNADGQIHGAA